MKAIETAMTEKGFTAEKAKEAQVLYVLALSDYAEQTDFVSKLAGCFTEDQTDEQLIAAVNSSLPENATAEVDYTLRRYIKKPSGSKPGFVIYTKNWSALVQADAALACKLKK